MANELHIVVVGLPIHILKGYNNRPSHVKAGEPYLDIDAGVIVRPQKDYSWRDEF